MVASILLLFLGFAILIKGADWLIEGVSVLAKKHQISDLAIGLTVVAFGTSAPELIVNSVASFQNQEEIVFGNVIGSSIFNVLLILGLVGLITPLKVHSSTVWKEIPLAFGSVVLLWLMVNLPLFGRVHSLQRIEGFFLFVVFCLFLLYVARQLKNEQSQNEPSTGTRSNWVLSLYIAIGLICLFAGGRLVVDHAIKIALQLGINERIVGLTIVAAGTSLPEAAASIVAALKKNNDIAVGNIVGSNIFNILFILSTSALIAPVDFDPVFNRDIYVLAGGTGLLFLAMFTGQKKKLDNWEAGILLIGFIIYTCYLIFFS